MRRLSRPVHPVLHLALSLVLAAGLGAAGAALARDSSTADQVDQIDHAEQIDPIDRIEALERAGPGHPLQTARELAALVGALPPGSPPWRRALVLRGQLLASFGEAVEAEREAARLETPVRAGAAPAPDAVAGAALIRARIQHRQGSMGRAERMLADARLLLPSTRPDVLAYQLVLAQAVVKEEAGATDESMRLYLDALQMATQLRSPWRRADVLRRLAWLTATIGQLDRATALNREAHEIALAEGDHLALSSILNTEVHIKSQSGDHDGELKASRAALAHARAAKAPRNETLLLANRADIHLKTGDYALAQSVSEQALGLARELGDRDTEIVALANRGLALVSMHRLVEGKRDLAAAFAIEEARGSLAGMAQTLAESGRYLERAGDQRGALDAYLQWRPLADRLYRQEQQKAVLEMQEAFDHAGRTRELSLLEADASLQRERLQAQNLRLQAWALGSVAVVLALVLLVPLARRVRRSNAELAEVNEQLAVQSERDPLTGLANRRRFMDAMRQFAADGRLRGSLFLVDIDHFKRINDHHGHAAGDTILVEVAQRLLRSVRANDLVVRWGGEEFLVVADDMAPASVEALAQRVLDAVAGAPFEHDGQPIAVSASVGWATFPVEPSQLTLPWEKALDLVDTALYLAKAHGRNRAYGVRALQAAHESDLAAIASSLEDAWRNGHVALTLLTGPQPRGVPA